MTMLPGHPHVLRLLGACIQPPLMALVTPYCLKCGPTSLHDTCLTGIHKQHATMGRYESRQRGLETA